MIYLDNERLAAMWKRLQRMDMSEAGHQLTRSDLAWLIGYAEALHSHFPCRGEGKRMAKAGKV